MLARSVWLRSNHVSASTSLRASHSAGSWIRAWSSGSSVANAMFRSICAGLVTVDWLMRNESLPGVAVRCQKLGFLFLRSPAKWKKGKYGLGRSLPALTASKNIRYRSRSGVLYAMRFSLRSPARAMSKTAKSMQILCGLTSRLRHRFTFSWRNSSAKRSRTVRLLMSSNPPCPERSSARRRAGPADRLCSEG